jgi:hypothetical protein
MTDERANVTVCSLDGPTCDRLPDFLIDDGVWSGEVSALRGIVQPWQDESRARHWLDAGAARVYLGEAALLDGELVGHLATRYGGARIGVYLPLRRMEVSWSLDTVSNADFRVVTPSICEPAWEILRADLSRSGTVASWWLQAMFERGAASAILRVDIDDDADLNLCAALTEAHGERLCFAPWHASANDFIEWTTWGRVTQLAASLAEIEHDAALVVLRGPQATEAIDAMVAAA